MRLRSKLVRQLKYPVRWMSFLAGGVPAILVFPAPSLSYLAWFALVPGMVLFTRAATTREAVARGWWFGAGYLIAMLYWMAPQIGPGLVLIGAVFGLDVVAVRRRGHRCSGPRSPGRGPLAAFVVVPSCWLIPEWIRSYQGLGGPWGLYGASQWQHPAVLALAGVGGVWLVSVALLHRQRRAHAAARRDAAGPARTRRRRRRCRGTAGRRRPGPSRPPPAALPRVRRRAGARRGRRRRLRHRGRLGPARLRADPAVPGRPAGRRSPWCSRAWSNDPVQRVDASETLTREFSSGKRAREEQPDLIVWGESSVAYDLAAPTTACSAASRSCPARHGAEILVSQDSTIPGPDGGQEKVAVLVSPQGIQGPT